MPETEWGTTDFFRSASAEDVRLALMQGADPNGQSPHWPHPLSRPPVTVFHEAVKACSDGEAIRAMIRAGAHLEKLRAPGSKTDLHLAAEHNPHPEIVRALIEEDASIEALAHGGETPLMVAALWNTPDVVEALLMVGADPNALDLRSYTCLHRSAWRGGDLGTRSRIIEMLLQAGADPTVEDQDSWTALHAAAIKDPDGVTVRQLLEAGAYPNVATRYENKTPLFEAAHHGNSGAIAALLEFGADPNRETSWGSTPLTNRVTARRENCMEDVKRLLEAGANPNFVGQQGQSPLHRAVRYGRAGSVRALLAAGADPAIVDGNGDTARDLAEVREARTCIDALTAAMEDAAPLPGPAPQGS